MANEEQIKVIDGSNDRGYFTIIPHYILNHSSAIDQALYMQMKRLAGEDGMCYASRAYLMKQLGVGKDAIAKSIKYLVSHNWISPVSGERKGKTGQLKVYKINDIWKMNMDTYRERGSNSASLSAKEGLIPPRKKEPNNTRSLEDTVKDKERVLSPAQKIVNQDVRKLFDHYMALHKEYISDKKPMVRWSQATNLAKPLVKELGLQRMVELMDAYFQDEKNKLYESNMWSLTCFLSTKVINILHQKT